MMKILLFAVLAISALVGCGGGSGSTGPTVVVSTLTFPLQSAYRALVGSGYSKNYSVEGTCSGRAIDSALAAAPAPLGVTFEGIQAELAADNRLTLFLSNCAPSQTTLFGTSFWDSNLVPLGEVVPGGDYSVFQTAPMFPVSVSVGTTGTFGVLNSYSDATKTVFTGRTDITFVIEAETATTAIVNLVAQDFDGGGASTGTQQSRYRIATTGALIPISIDIQFADGTRLRLQ